MSMYVTVNVLSEVGITATQLLSSVVDTISPTLNLQVIGTTSDSTPIIQGTSDLINGVVEVQLDGGSVLTTTVNAAGLFSLEVDGQAFGLFPILGGSSGAMHRMLIFSREVEGQALSLKSSREVQGQGI